MGHKDRALYCIDNRRRMPSLLTVAQEVEASVHFALGVLLSHYWEGKKKHVSRQANPAL